MIADVAMQPRTFTSAETGDEIQTVSFEGELRIIAGPLAKALGYRDAADMVRTLPEDEKGTQSVRTPGGVQNVSVVTQPGLYRILSNRRLGAVKDDDTRNRIESFQRWVFHEVIPAAVAGEATPPPTAAPATLPTRRELALMVVEAEDRADAAEALAASRSDELAVVAPKAESWDILASADGDWSVADAAKTLSRDPNIKLGQQRLFSYLGEINWLYRARGDRRWRVMQSQVETGRLSELPSSHYHPRTGDLVLDPPQVRITTKGLQELHRRLGGTQLAITA